MHLQILKLAGPKMTHYTHMFSVLSEKHTGEREIPRALVPSLFSCTKIKDNQYQFKEKTQKKTFKKLFAAMFVFKS